MEYQGVERFVGVGRGRCYFYGGPLADVVCIFRRPRRPRFVPCHSRARMMGKRLHQRAVMTRWVQKAMGLA